MNEENLAKLKKLLEAARPEYFALATGDDATKALGKFILETAIWETLVIKNTTGGYTVEVEA